jgi:hypothetical protein
MKGIMSKKTVIFSVVFSLTNLATLLGSSILLRAVAQPEIFVTKGYISNSRLVAREKLTVGREWSVYDLETGRYYGRAEVNNTTEKDEAGDCIQETKSIFNLDNIISTKNTRDVLFIRTASDSKDKLKIEKSFFNDLPTTFKQSLNIYPHIHSFKKGRYSKIDYNSDGKIDIIYADAIRKDHEDSRSAIFANINNRWILKYENSCTFSGG